MYTEPSYKNYLFVFGLSLYSSIGPFNDCLNYPPFNYCVCSSINKIFFDFPFTLDKLNFSIKQLKINSPGLDSIRNSVLKILSSYGLFVLLEVFNSIHIHDIIPQYQDWRNFEIILFLKPGRLANQISSFRLIAKTSCVRKLFKKILKDRLEYYINTNNILHAAQYGYGTGESTSASMALFGIIKFINSITI